MPCARCTAGEEVLTNLADEEDLEHLSRSKLVRAKVYLEGAQQPATVASSSLAAGSLGHQPVQAFHGEGKSCWATCCLPLLTW